MLRILLFIAFFMLILWSPLQSQERPDRAVFEDPETSFWLGGYGTFRLSEKFFWAGELHYRRSEYDGTPFIGRMGQIYNRHGLQWIPNKKFKMTVGGVLRLDFSSDPKSDEYKDLVLEPRIWHEYLFVLPFSRFNMYHRIRIEHRWNRSTRIGSEYSYRNRYRYKFLMKIPLNSRELQPGTCYFSPDVELIMQSGSPVIDSPVEDLRIFPTVAYIYSPQITFSGGVMYTFGQRISNGAVYRQRWIPRLNVYLSLDFRKIDERVPEVRF